MKKLLFIITMSVMICSCSVVYGPNTSDAAKRLELGMSKQEAINIMGKDYIMESVMQLRNKTLEVLHFRSTYYYDYLLHFVDGELVEFHRYTEPTSTVTQQNPPRSKDNSERIRQNIVSDLMSEDNKGGRKTVRKDIFGDTVIEDNKGNKKTIKKDIFRDYIIEDNKGNKTTIKKEVFEKQ